MSALWDCATCGACCREAFDEVPLEVGEAMVVARPDVVVVDASGRRSIRRVPSAVRAGTRCCLLAGDGVEAPYRCTDYGVRPAACSELDIGSDGCVFARARVGLPVDRPWTG